MLSIGLPTWFAPLRRTWRSRTVERRAADRRYRRILEQSREVIYETGDDGRWTYLNPAWTDLTGQDPADGIGTSFLALIEPEDRAGLIERMAALYRGDAEECRQEVRFRHVDGDVRWASVRSRIMRDEHDQITGTYGNIHDVTDRRVADDARIESERLYRLLADNSNDMIVRLSLQGVRRYVSPASLQLLGYTPEELLGAPAAGAIHPDDRAIAIATCASLLDGAENPMCVYRQLRKDGTYIWLEASYRLIRDADGAPIELIATVRDVSAREKAELAGVTAANQLSEANRLLLMAEEMSRVGHWRVDIASGAVFWSDVVCAIHGFESGHAPVLDDAIAFYHPDDRELVQRAVDDAVSLGRHFAFNARIIRRDGAIRHIVTNGRVEHGPDGSPVGLFGVIQDVTEAHDANVALETANRQILDSNRLLTMAETVGQLGHWRIDYRTGAMLWSDEVYRIYGLPGDTEPTAENALAVYHPDDVAAVREAVARARASEAGYTSNARIVRTDGSIAHIVTRAEVEFDDAGSATALFGIVQDVTERVTAQAEVQENEARFRLLTEQAGDVISLHDRDGNCLFMSPSVKAVLGYDPVEMQGRALQSLIVPEDQAALARLRRELDTSAAGEVAVGRFRLRRKDGRLVWLEAAARIANYREQPRRVVVSRDVTDQVRAEAELAAARDRAELAVQAKSSFLANMSHEIRTPMNGVIGFTDLMLAGELCGEQRRRAEMIAESGRAMMHLLNDILDLSKVEAGQMVVSDDAFDLVPTLQACMQLVSPALEKKGVAARCDFAADLPPVVCGDALRVRQIVLNLLGNAVKFTERGEVLLRVSCATPGTVRIVVADTGPGIAPERQAAIFEAFVQAETGTASVFGGTGLGLSISARLAALMGGTLTLESEPGRGSCFTLDLPLPASDRPAAAPSADTPLVRSTVLAANHLNVLVAEDHDVNQMLLTAMLTQLGCDVTIAPNGAEAAAAAEAAQAAGKQFDLLFMDSQMPVLDGAGAARRIRAAGIGPDALPIVALTANAFAEDVAAALAAGMQAHVAKPVTLEQLETALRQWARGASPTAAPPVIEPVPAAGGSIRDRYRARKEEALAAVDALVRGGQYTDVEVHAVTALLHKLAGTAAMFGEPELGDEARALETGLTAWPPEDRARRIADAADALRKAA